MRAVCYCRVSSDAQRDRHTIASQLTAIPAYVKQQGWTLVKPATTYVDDGKSAKAGRLDKREAFTRLLADAAAGLFDVVCVVDVNRLTRSEDLTERGLILGAFQRAQVKIATLSQGIQDLGTAHGDLFVSLQAIMAADDNRKRSEATKRGQRNAAGKGKKALGRDPYGYRSNAGRLEEHPEHGTIVREIFRRVANGETCGEVGRDLERRKVPAPNGGRWSLNLSSLIPNPRYRGTWTQCGLPIQIPALVDDVTWYAAQEAVSRNRTHGGGPRTKHVYLCAKISRCGNCGAVIYVETFTDTRGQRRSYYVCKRARHPDPDGKRCNLPMRRVDGIDAELWRELSEFLSTPGRAERLLLGRKRSASEDASAWETDLAQAKSRLTRIEEAEAAILSRFTRGLISESAMDSHVKATAKERAFIAEQIRSASTATTHSKSAGIAAADVLSTLTSLRSKLDSADAVTRRAIVKALIPGRDPLTVTIYPAQVVARLAVPVLGTAETRPNTSGVSQQNGTGKVVTLRIAA